MAHKIQIKRGSKADLPVLNDGEMGLCIDTQEVFVGSNGTNIPVSYAHPTTAGNKHIPSGGASGQILRYSASGTAVWGADNDTITTVNGKTGAITKADIVALGIPAQDTVYTHPANHPPSIITQDANNRFVTDAEKTTWNAKSGKGDTFTVSLTLGGWSGNTQTVSDAKFVTSGYGYVVSPSPADFGEYTSAIIRAGDVTTAGQLTFTCGEVPSQALTVNVLRVEVNT